MAYLVKLGRQTGQAHDKASAGHGLVLPCPSGIAATLLLVIGIRLKLRDQHARTAIGAQGSIDLIQVTLASFDGHPIDELSHIVGIDFLSTFIGVFVHKHDVQIAAIAQFLAPQLAITNDGNCGRFAVTIFEPIPTPTGSHA